MRTSAPRLATAFAAVGILCLVASGSAATVARSKFVIGHFKTPSRNIVCDYNYGGRIPENITCLIQSGLKPPPHRIACPVGDPIDDRVSLNGTGRPTEPRCAGDPGPYLSIKQARVFAYGHTWRHGRLRCSSKKTGLTCVNSQGHGFFLSRAHSRLF
jgi:hypothetical protein